MKSIKLKFSDYQKVVKKLKDGIVDLFYVDSPYGIGYKSWDSFKDKDEFIEFTERWIKLFVRKLKPGGTMIVFMAKENLFANKNKKICKGVINILEEYGTVHIDNWITWKRQKGRGSKHKAKSLREEIIHFTKHPKDYTWNSVEMKRDVVTPYVKDGRPRGWFVDEATGRRVRWTGIGDVWMYSSPQWNGLLDKQRHSAQKPFLLVERIILLFSNKGDFVVDPFMGSGVCAHVCRYHGRKYLGTEINKDIFNDALKYYINNYKQVIKVLQEGSQRVMRTKINWERYNKKGYEVSSKGDKRFSAFNAILDIGKIDNWKSIEYYYQVKIKGYDSIKEGKGKPPIIKISRMKLYEAYKKLWRDWAKQNPKLMKELRIKAEEHNNCLTDMFANSDINQARALSEILNEEN